MSSKRRLCSICVRGGSKGLPGKNKQLFGQKPLLAHAIFLAKEAKLFEVVAVSSDCEELLALAKAHGADLCVKRPSALATDNAAKLPAIQHCARRVESELNVEFDTFVDIAATSPLTVVEDLCQAVALFEKSDAINLVSVTVARNSPYYSQLEKNQSEFCQLVKQSPLVVDRRQDAPLCYDMNGAIYIWRKDTFYQLNQVITEKTLCYEMPAERSIDIDSALDFDIAEFIYSKRLNTEMR